MESELKKKQKSSYKEESHREKKKSQKGKITHLVEEVELMGKTSCGL